MQLLSMEVNQSGTGDRYQIASLAPGLNAVCGRRGSGKTSLLRWLRGMIQPAACELSPGWNPLASRFDDRPAWEHATGRVGLRVGPLDYELERREHAGHAIGKVLRRTTAAWNGSHRSGDSLSSDVLSPLQKEAFELLASIASDPQACDRLWEAARALNLDAPSRPQFADQRLQLTTREQELVARLEALEGMTSTREGLLARRRQLEADLDRARRESSGRHYAPATDEHHRLSDRLTAIGRDAQKLREEIAQLDAALSHASASGSLAIDPLVRTAQERSYRERLLALDAQLARWRNTLSEIRAHRERLEASATDAQLEGQLGEQFSPVNQATPRLALRALEAQIIEARRHFDALLEGVDRYRNDQDDARNELPQTLRLMQRELHEVCQQLSRHESLTVSRATKEQILQLSRCESEMRLAIERLIAERGELLRSIASACHMSADQVTVAFSDSCRCADHPPMDAWLAALSPARESALGLGLNDQVAAASGLLASPLAVDELTQLSARRSSLQLRLQDCERELRETEVRLHRLGGAPVPAALDQRVEAELLSEMDHVTDELQRLESRDRLRVELTDVRRRLRDLPRDVEDSRSLRGRYQLHLASLTGSGDGRNGTASTDGQALPFDRERESRQGRLKELSLRLAIVELLAARGAPIPLVLDQTLDGLDGPQRLAAVRYLANHCHNQALQVIALTEDHALADAVKAARGNVIPIVVSHAIPPARSNAEIDVNRQLLAYANDFEADKWGQPDPVRPPVRNEHKRRFLLTERSPIEDVPSINAVSAARLRALGVDRVADLLDSQPHWIADNARLDGVNAEAVVAWQSEARLLCAMPQLRPFDARILAGAGIRDQRQLAEMHPSRLLERVERFLASDRGRQIMRSGSSYELARITAWIASAKRNSTAPHSDEGDEPGPAFGVDPTGAAGGQRGDSFQRHHSAHGSAPTYHIVEREDAESESTSDRRLGSKASRRQRGERAPRAEGQRRAAHSQTSDTANEDAWQFHLELSSPVVDAPSIGTTMASQLEALGVVTVDDLLTADPDRLASELNLPRVSATTIRAWQEQAQLVCRIPNLRGHDAQVLVACGIAAPESLARLEPNKLLAQAIAFAKSAKGQRVLRGSQVPDLAEVTDWIQWAVHSRPLTRIAG
ncbi:MAG: DUF4332 domain-containing protein [Aureliella sp.]